MSHEPRVTTAVIKGHRVTRLRDGIATTVDDCLIIEEPLEIRIDGRRFTTTMRTPGHDLELARGLLLTEGVIQSNDDIEDISAHTRCREKSQELVNVVNVVLHDGPAIPGHLWERSLISNSSCGLCGKASIEALSAKVQPVPEHEPMTLETLLRLPHLLRAGQSLFEQTGGLHAAGLFDAAGRCRALFEDIGRHNATDKAIGYGLEQGWLPWRGYPQPLALLVSGRASFEITQKALMARIPIVCAVSAASTLAVELAEANRQTLIGFLRERGMTIYCGTEAG